MHFFVSKRDTVHSHRSTQLADGWQEDSVVLMTFTDTFPDTEQDLSVNVIIQLLLC